MPSMICRSILAVAIAVLAPSLRAATPVAADAKPPESSVPPAVSPRTASIQFEFAIYFLPAAERDPMAVLREHAKAFPKLQVVDAVASDPATPVVAGRWLKDASTTYAPPDMRMLQLFGRGLTREQAKALQRSTQTLVLDFAHDRAHALSGLSEATRLTAEIAKDTGGFLWDEQTRETFTVDEWTRRRVFDPAQGAPDVSTHTVIHAYKDGDYVRAITLGLIKFGVPDVVIGDSSWESNRQIGNLINAVAQSLIEGAPIPLTGDYTLDLRAILNGPVRAKQLESLRPRATGVVELRIGSTKRDEGDPENRLIELGFDRYPGADVHARQDAALSSLFGWEDALSQIKHDDDLLAESASERSKLPALRKRFRDGLEPGEFIELKAPFATPDGGREWMWVEVITWNGKAIKGLLRNEPFNIPDLHGGTEVEINEDDVFDYILRHADGTQEGNTTAALIEKLK